MTIQISRKQFAKVAKLQITGRGYFSALGILNLELLWCLGFGVWSFSL